MFAFTVTYMMELVWAHYEYHTWHAYFWKENSWKGSHMGPNLERIIHIQEKNMKFDLNKHDIESLHITLEF